MEKRYSALKKQSYRGMKICGTLGDPLTAWSGDHKLKYLRVIQVTQMCEVSWVGGTTWSGEDDGQLVK